MLFSHFHACGRLQLPIELGFFLWARPISMMLRNQSSHPFGPWKSTCWCLLIIKIRIIWKFQFEIGLCIGNALAHGFPSQQTTCDSGKMDLSHAANRTRIRFKKNGLACIRSILWTPLLDGETPHHWQGWMKTLLMRCQVFSGLEARRSTICSPSPRM